MTGNSPKKLKSTQETSSKEPNEIKPKPSNKEPQHMNGNHPNSPKTNKFTQQNSQLENGVTKKMNQPLISDIFQTLNQPQHYKASLNGSQRLDNSLIGGKLNESEIDKLQTSAIDSPKTNESTVNGGTLNGHHPAFRLKQKLLSKNSEDSFSVPQSVKQPLPQPSKPKGNPEVFVWDAEKGVNNHNNQLPVKPADPKKESILNELIGHENIFKIEGGLSDSTKLQCGFNEKFFLADHWETTKESEVKNQKLILQSSETFQPVSKPLDEWDQEYDKPKQKKIKKRTLENVSNDEMNPFQEFYNEKKQKKSQARRNPTSQRKPHRTRFSFGRGARFKKITKRFSKHHKSRKSF